MWGAVKSVTTQAEPSLGQPQFSPGHREVMLRAGTHFHRLRLEDTARVSTHGVSVEAQGDDRVNSTGRCGLWV